jgi:hypothetical protein
LLRHCGLGKQQLFGGSAEVKVKCNSAKYLEPEIFHRVSLNALRTFKPFYLKCS